MTHKFTSAELSTMLVADLNRLIGELGLTGQQYGCELKMLNPHRNDKNIGSFSINISGGGRGKWAEFSDSDARGGEPLSFVAYVLTGNKTATKEVFDWVYKFLGIGDNFTDSDRAKMREQARQKQEQYSREQKQQIEDNIKMATKIWLDGKTMQVGDAVFNYLCHRGVSPNLLPYYPKALRLAYLNHTEHGQCPTMVAGVINNTGKIIAVHRTFLKQEWDSQKMIMACDKVRGVAKKVLGSSRGGWIPVWGGVNPETGKAYPPVKKRKNVHIYMTEGIEDALSVALIRPSATVIACISVGNIQNIVLPETVAEITMIADTDEVGSPAEQSLNKGLRELAKRHGVKLLKMPKNSLGKQYKDINDWLNSELKINDQAGTQEGNSDGN